MRTLAQDFPPRPLICPGFPFSRRITFFIKKLYRKRPPQVLRRAFSIIIFNKNQCLRREKLCPRINRRERSPHANLSAIVVLHPAIVVLPPQKIKNYSDGSPKADFRLGCRDCFLRLRHAVGYLCALRHAAGCFFCLLRRRQAFYQRSASRIRFTRSATRCRGYSPRL